MLVVIGAPTVFGYLDQMACGMTGGTTALGTSRFELVRGLRAWDFGFEFGDLLVV